MDDTDSQTCLPLVEPPPEQPPRAPRHAIREDALKAMREAAQKAVGDETWNRISTLVP